MPARQPARSFGSAPFFYFTRRRIALSLRVSG